jgi:hypothetical protein
MSDINVEAVTGYTKLVGQLANVGQLSKVVLWDLGPEKPDYPKRPVAPKPDTPEYDAALLEHKYQLATFEEQIVAYQRDKAMYDQWKKSIGGPMEFEFWSCDATSALENDARAVKEGRQKGKRWYLSASTRGHGNLKNLGLPEGMKPGPGQERRLQKIAAGEDAMLQARRNDPVFGEVEIRQ